MLRLRKTTKINKEHIFGILFITAVFIYFLSKNVMANNLEGPVASDVIRVVDGDTIVVTAKIWLNQNLETTVRIKGIDAPELKGKCESETKLALKAKKFVEDKIKTGVFLYDVSFDKYGGRVVARVVYFDDEAKENKDIGEELLKNNLAVSYDGKKKHSVWCDYL